MSPCLSAPPTRKRVQEAVCPLSGVSPAPKRQEAACPPSRGRPTRSVQAVQTGLVPHFARWLARAARARQP
eukprot:3836243-Lingulodinium_polyedra.AAC.1